MIGGSPQSGDANHAILLTVELKATFITRLSGLGQMALHMHLIGSLGFEFGSTEHTHEAWCICVTAFDVSVQQFALP